MAQSYRTTSAKELRSILERHEGNAARNEINIELALFRPFTDPSVLSASRNAESRHPPDGLMGKRCSVNNDEYLDLTMLGKEWREAWVEVVRAMDTSPMTVTFDPTLPKHWGVDSKTQGIWWSVQDGEMDRSPDAIGLHVIDREFWALVVVLATEGRMLSKGSIKFKLLDEPLHGWQRSNLVRLHEHLDALSKCMPTDDH